MQKRMKTMTTAANVDDPGKNTLVTTNWHRVLVVTWVLLTAAMALVMVLAALGGYAPVLPLSA